MLKRLCQRGIFKNDNGAVIVLMPKEDFHQRQSEQFVADTFNGSLPAYIATFTKGKTLSDEDADEIQRLIDHSRIHNKDITNYARAPRWISMILWGLVALRLIVPFHLSSAVSLFQLRNISNLSARIEKTLDHEGNYSGDYKTALEGSTEYKRAVAAGVPVTTNAAGDRMAYYYMKRFLTMVSHIRQDGAESTA